MTDTSTVPATDATATPPPAALTTQQLAASGLEQTLTQTLRSAPELTATPGTAVAVASSGGTGVVGTAQGVGAVVKGTNSLTAAQQVHSAGGDGILGDVAHFIGHAAGDAWDAVGKVASSAVVHPVLATLNSGLSLAQHEYRYLHDVEATHGPWAAALEGIGIAAGAIGGGLLAGPEGAVVGAEAIGGIEGQLAYRDSWNRTADGSKYVDPHTRTSVSIGRDVASVLGLGHSGTGFDVVSGGMDALFDFGADPLARAGRLVAKVNAGSARGIIASNFEGLHPVTGEDVERIYAARPDVQRAFGMIAKMNAGDIAAEFPELAGAQGLAVRLQNADTPDAVARVFRDAFTANELVETDRLPTMSLSRLPFHALRQAAQNYTGPLAESALVGPQVWARRILRMPQAFNPETMDFSSSEFNPGDDYGASGLYRMLRFGHTDAVARQVTNDYLNNPDVWSRIKIRNNAVLSTVYAMAHIDPETYGELLAGRTPSALKELLDNFPGQTGVYGVDKTGHNISSVIDDETGRTFTAAITQNQLGKLRYPSLVDLRRAAEQLSGGRTLFGKVDDFMYQHLTQTIFKPLALLTPAYAMHISLAELIPNSLRAGVRNLVKAAVATNYARMEAGTLGRVGTAVTRGTGMRALGELANRSDGELDAISALAWKLVGGDRGIVPSKDDLNTAARLLDMNNGHIVAPGVSSEHAYSNEIKGPERDGHLLRSSAFATPIAARRGKNFGLFWNHHEQFTNEWQSWLAEISHDEPSQIAARRLLVAAREGRTATEAERDAQYYVRSWLDAQPEENLSQFMRHHLYSTPKEQRPIGWTPHDDWAKVVVANVRGATTGGGLQGMHSVLPTTVMGGVQAVGKTGEMVHVPLLRDIAEGRVTSTQDLDSIDPIDRPPMVKGRQLVPFHEAAIQKVANFGFSRALNPMVNFLSRQPIYFQEVKEQLARLEPQIRAGHLDEDEAWTVAQARAVNRVIRNVHNLHDRTQWTVTLRNWAPFFFAQEQAYRRAGRLLAEDPGAFRRYQLEIMAVHDIGTRQSDGQGNSYFIVPGTGFLGAGVPDALSRIGVTPTGSAPVGIGWNLGATSVMFPLSAGARPDFGPVAAIPIKAAAMLFPELQGAANDVLGGATMSDSVWSQLVPNSFVQRAIQTAQGNDRSFYSAMMQTMQALDYQGKIPPATASPDDMQQFIGRVKNQTRIVFAVRALLGLVTPVSPEVSIENYGFPTELNNDITAAGSVSKGIAAFLAKHPDATPWTVFQSTSKAGGASLPSSIEGENWIQSNRGFLNQYPAAGFYFMPQLTDSKYSAAVYNEQIAQGWREKFDPTANPIDDPGKSFLAQLYVSAGNDTYYRSLPAHELAQGKLTGVALAQAQSQFPNIHPLSGSAKTQEQSNWNSYVTQLQAQNPVWGLQYLGGGWQQQQVSAITELRQIFASGSAPQGPMADNIKQLLTSYNNYENAISAGRQDGFASGEATQLKSDYQAFMRNIAVEHPELGSVIKNVFLYVTT